MWKQASSRNISDIRVETKSKDLSAPPFGEINPALTMEDIVANEGEDYRAYSADSKKVIASCASVAVSVKSILDTPLFTDDGLLTEESEGTATNIEGFLNNMRIGFCLTQGARSEANC